MIPVGIPATRNNQTVYEVRRLAIWFGFSYCGFGVVKTGNVVALLIGPIAIRLNIGPYKFVAGQPVQPIKLTREMCVQLMDTLPAADRAVLLSVLSDYQEK